MRISTDPDRHSQRCVPAHVRVRTRVRVFVVVAWIVGAGWPGFADGGAPALGPLPDPSARMLEASGASEYWTLFVELESGHRITQRFLVTNAGPGSHTAVAVGHLLEPGREPYRYQNGRRRARWKLSQDRLFLDIAASHLDLHRPQGELRITKDDIEIRLFFDFAPSDLSGSVPSQRLPSDYGVDILAVAAPTRGSIHAPWMAAAVETTGRTWLVHSWMLQDEATILDRRIDFYGYGDGSIFYGLQLRNRGRSSSHWVLGRNRSGQIIESSIKLPEIWTESDRDASLRGSSVYPLPGDFRITGKAWSGRIALTPAWLRFDPLEVIPNPFRWFIRRMTQPQEVWADARIDVTLSHASDAPLLPKPGAGESKSENQTETASTSNSERETADATATSRMKGVAAITFLNPAERR